MPVVCRVDAKLLDWTSIIHLKFHVRIRLVFVYITYIIGKSSASKKFSQFQLGGPIFRSGPNAAASIATTLIRH